MSKAAYFNSGCRKNDFDNSGGFWIHWSAVSAHLNNRRFTDRSPRRIGMIVGENERLLSDAGRCHLALASIRIAGEISSSHARIGVTSCCQARYSSFWAEKPKSFMMRLSEAKDNFLPNSHSISTAINDGIHWSKVKIILHRDIPSRHFTWSASCECALGRRMFFWIPSSNCPSKTTTLSMYYIETGGWCFIMPRRLTIIMSLLIFSLMVFIISLMLFSRTPSMIMLIGAVRNVSGEEILILVPWAIRPSRQVFESPIQRMSCFFCV